MTRRDLLAPAAGVAIGLAYGFFARWNFGSRPPASQKGDLFVGLTLVFLFFVPFLLGAVAARLAPGATRSWTYALLLPLVSAALLLISTAGVAREGAPCLLIVSPAALVMALIGGVVAGALYRARRKG